MNSWQIIRINCRHVDYVRNVYSDHKLDPLQNIWYIKYNKFAILEKDKYINIC